MKVLKSFSWHDKYQPCQNILEVLNTFLIMSCFPVGFFLMYLSVFLPVFMCTMCMSGIHRGQKRALDSLEPFFKILTSIILTWVLEVPPTCSSLVKLHIPLSAGLHIPLSAGFIGTKGRKGVWQSNITCEKHCQPALVNWLARSFVWSWAFLLYLDLTIILHISLFGHPLCARRKHSFHSFPSSKFLCPSFQVFFN